MVQKVFNDANKGQTGKNRLKLPRNCRTSILKMVKWIKNILNWGNSLFWPKDTRTIDLSLLVLDFFLKQWMKLIVVDSIHNSCIIYFCSRLR